MSLPPKDVTPQALWAALQQRPRPHKIVDFPACDDKGIALGQVAIWVLKKEESMSANAEAERFARKLLKEGKQGDLGYEALFGHEGMVQTLFRACRDHEDPNRAAFPNPEALRSLTDDEIEVLFQHYLTVKLELGPIIVEMTEPELDAWVKKLAEGQRFFFDRCSSEMRWILVNSLAKRLQTSSMVNSSAGSPLDLERPKLSDESIRDLVDEAREVMKRLSLAFTIIGEGVPAFLQAADSLANFEAKSASESPKD